MYKLRDLNEDTISGWFYTSELQKVNKDENSLWFIEKIWKKESEIKKCNI